MEKKKYTGSGLLLNVLIRLVIPGFFIWFIPYLIDHKIIDEKKDAWAGTIIVPLMIALIIGTGINLLYIIYYVIMTFVQDNNTTPNQ